MKKSVLTSLILATAVFTGTAFAGSYTADAGYTAADTSAMAGNQSGFLDALYVGVGVNKSATNSNYQTSGEEETPSDTITSSKYGYNLFVGKKLNELFAVELSYNSYGKNETTAGDVVTTNGPMWSTMLMGVVTSPSYYGISVHGKAGAAYSSVTTHVDTNGAETSESQYRGSNFAYGFGLEYDYNQFGVSFDWTRVQTESTGTLNNTVDMYIPDVYSLNFIYNI